MCEFYMCFVYIVLEKEGRFLLFSSLSDSGLDCARPKEISVVSSVPVSTWGRAAVAVALVSVRSGRALLLCCITCLCEVRVYSSAPALLKKYRSKGEEAYACFLRYKLRHLGVCVV